MIETYNNIDSYIPNQTENGYEIILDNDSKRNNLTSTINSNGYVLYTSEHVRTQLLESSYSQLHLSLTEVSRYSAQMKQFHSEIRTCTQEQDSCLLRQRKRVGPLVEFIETAWFCSATMLSGVLEMICSCWKLSEVHFRLCNTDRCSEIFILLHFD